ncbi:hypothetical protein CKO40_20065 [Halochromatium glycolicum]|jgi:hypothetical protein|uniref:Uncharacterized protein n=2 Tax=Halochromatium glycolicum TaxID=85075 RepID=A0AAJ0XC19_9GAMM|nr:hypothetical protein [Halochromatium glycolicum]
MVVETPPAGIVPHPQCSGCKQFKMEFIGDGVAPVLPPPPPPGTRTAQWQAQAAAMTDVPKVLYSGSGANHGAMVDYSVSENTAKAVVQVDYRVGSSNNRTVAFHNSLLTRQGPPADWLIKPAFGVLGSPLAWASLDPKKLPPGAVLSDAPKMPQRFDVVMPLGNHAFGLIHLLAGHLKDARSLTGPPSSGLSAEDEVYRTTQGVQRGIGEALSPGGLNAVALEDPVNRKWIFLGANGVTLVVRGHANGAFSATTMFKGGKIAPTARKAWKRRGVVL